jgi:hypothetical protein
MAIQTKMVFRFSGVKLDAIGPNFEPDSARPGGVAQGSEGPIDQFAGMGETHMLNGVTFRIRPTGLAFKPWEHTLPGQEFDVDFDQGDPQLGGTTVTYQGCLCVKERTRVNNEQGDIVVETDIRATRRIPESA